MFCSNCRGRSHLYLTLPIASIKSSSQLSKSSVASTEDLFDVGFRRGFELCYFFYRLILRSNDYVVAAAVITDHR